VWDKHENGIIETTKFLHNTYHTFTCIATQQIMCFVFMSEMSMFSGYASMKKSVLIWGVIITFFNVYEQRINFYI